MNHRRFLYPSIGGYLYEIVHAKRASVVLTGGRPAGYRHTRTHALLGIRRQYSTTRRQMGLTCVRTN